MAITVKYLEDLGVEKEVAEKIFAERSKEIEADKAKREKLETELKEKTESLESLTTEIDTLKTSGKNAEEIQAKLDAMIAEREAEKKKAEADRIMKEKLEATKSRFEKANEGKGEWYNEPTKDFYFKKFSDALESEEYAGQSDVDILHSLSKDDQSARKGVTAVKLAGGKPQGVGSKYSSKDEIMAIKDGATRRAEMIAHSHLFPEMNK
ncbi:MAG: hypothetical protein IKY67_05870 [Paludibacteraceae bacterium]|nr:hypothetical protein [Paludibacteraceae bacterium]